MKTASTIWIRWRAQNIISRLKTNTIDRVACVLAYARLVTIRRSIGVALLLRKKEFSIVKVLDLKKGNNMQITYTEEKVYKRCGAKIVFIGWLDLWPVSG